MYIVAYRVVVHKLDFTGKPHRTHVVRKVCVNYANRSQELRMPFLVQIINALDEGGVLGVKVSDR